MFWVWRWLRKVTGSKLVRSVSNGGRCFTKKKKKKTNMCVCVYIYDHTHTCIYGAHQVIAFPKVDNSVNTDSAG